MKRNEWIPTSDNPKFTGLYEVKFHKGSSVVRFWTGWGKNAWLPVGSKNCMSESMPQPTHWREIDEWSNDMWDEFPQIYEQ